MTQEARGKTYRIRVSEGLILKAFTEGAEWIASRCIEGFKEPTRIVRVDLEPWRNEIVLYVETEEPVSDVEPIKDFTCVYQTIEPVEDSE